MTSVKQPGVNFHQSRAARLSPATTFDPFRTRTVSRAADVGVVQCGQVVQPVQGGPGALIVPSQEQICLVGGLRGRGAG